MIINILLPYKEKFDVKNASSVSLTVKNNLNHSIYKNEIKIFGQYTEHPISKENFKGINYSYFSFKSKNKYLANQMCKSILESKNEKQLIEVHNRPYLITSIIKKVRNIPVSIFFHNDPKDMKGSQSVLERENILKRCVAVFCVSAYIKKQFLEGLRTNSEKVFVLYNGVQRKPKKFPLKNKEIIFVGRLVFSKGAHLYVDVAKSLASQFPDWTFSLLGSFKLGDNKKSNKYAENIIKNFRRIGPQAKFYGFKDNDFVQEQMKNAAIIVIPSLWEEPFGLVAAEAMGNGIAIIASRSGGIPEIVQENGILIENINHKKLEEALKEILINDEKRIFYQKTSWNNFKLSSQSSSRKLDQFRLMLSKKYF